MPRELIPIMLFMVLGFVGFTFSPIGTAIAKRLARGGGADSDEVNELRADVADLRAELDEVRAKVAHVDELQDRMDFAERMLAQAKAKGLIPGAEPR
jgi:hypothetical protein